MRTFLIFARFALKLVDFFSLNKASDKDLFEGAVL
jgi:hypothetical protein